MLLNPFFGFSGDAPLPEGVASGGKAVEGDPFQEILQSVQQANGGEQSALSPQSNTSGYPSLAQVIAETMAAEESQQSAAATSQHPGLERQSSDPPLSGQTILVNTDPEVPVEPGQMNGVTRVASHEQIQPLAQGGSPDLAETDPAIQPVPNQTELPFVESEQLDSGEEQPTIVSHHNPQTTTVEEYDQPEVEAQSSQREAQTSQQEQAVSIDRDDSEIVSRTGEPNGNDWMDRQRFAAGRADGTWIDDRDGGDQSSSSLGTTVAEQTRREQPAGEAPRSWVAQAQPEEALTNRQSTSGGQTAPRRPMTTGPQIPLADGIAETSDRSKSIEQQNPPEQGEARTISREPRILTAQRNTSGDALYEPPSEPGRSSEEARLEQPRIPTLERDVAAPEIGRRSPDELRTPVTNSAESTQGEANPRIDSVGPSVSAARVDAAIRALDSSQLARDVATTLSAQQDGSDEGGEINARVADLLGTVTASRPLRGTPDHLQADAEGTLSTERAPRTGLPPVDTAVRATQESQRQQTVVGSQMNGSEDVVATSLDSPDISQPVNRETAEERPITPRDAVSNVVRDVRVRSEVSAEPQSTSQTDPIWARVEMAQQAPVETNAEPEVQLKDLLPTSRPEAPFVSSTPSTPDAGFTPTVGATGVRESLPPVETIVEQQAPAPTEVEETKVTHQIVRGARFLTREGASQVTLRLDPPELGEVTIRLSSADKALTGEIRVESRMVQEIVNRNIAELRESLGSQGIQVDRIDVTVDSGSRSGVDRDGGSAFRRETTDRDNSSPSDRERSRDNDPEQDRTPRRPFEEGRFDAVA